MYTARMLTRSAPHVTYNSLTAPPLINICLLPTQRCPRAYATKISSTCSGAALGSAPQQTTAHTLPIPPPHEVTGTMNLARKARPNILTSSMS